MAGRPANVVGQQDFRARIKLSAGSMAGAALPASIAARSAAARHCETK
jgi:hypothetical protein